MIVAIVVASVALIVALIAYSQSQIVASVNNFGIEVYSHGGEDWYYLVWYMESQTLTDVCVLLDGKLVRHYDVFAPSFPNHDSNPIFEWTSIGLKSATVEIQWNGGRQVLTYNP